MGRATAARISGALRRVFVLPGARVGAPHNSLHVTSAGARTFALIIFHGVAPRLRRVLSDPMSPSARMAAH